MYNIHNKRFKKSFLDCCWGSEYRDIGPVVWGADQWFAADLTVGGSGTAGGNLHVEGTWEAPGSVGNFKISGMLGGKQVTALARGLDAGTGTVVKL